MATNILGFIQAILESATPPVNTAMLWYDTNVNIHKYYNTGTASWVPLISSGQALSTILGNGNTSGGNDLIMTAGDVINAQDYTHATSINFTAPSVNIDASTGVFFTTAPTQDDTIDEIIVRDPVSGQLHFRDASTLGVGSVTFTYDPDQSEFDVGGTTQQVLVMAGNAIRTLKIGNSVSTAKLSVRGGGLNLLDLRSSTDAQRLTVSDTGAVTFTAAQDTSIEHSVNTDRNSASPTIDWDFKAGSAQATAAADKRTHVGFFNDIGDGNGQREWFAIRHDHLDDAESFSIWALDPANPGTDATRPIITAFAGDGTNTRNVTVIGGDANGANYNTAGNALFERSLYINHRWIWLLDHDTPGASGEFRSSSILNFNTQIFGSSILIGDKVQAHLRQNSATINDSYFILGYESFAGSASRSLVITQPGNFGIGLNNPAQKLHVSTGDVRFDSYVSSRDDSGGFAPNNFIYTDTNGKLLSAPLSAIPGVAGVPTSREINTGEGLTGGGNLTVNRTFALDLNGLTAEASPVVGDYLVIYDVSEAGHRKVLISDIASIVGGSDNLGDHTATQALDMDGNTIQSVTQITGPNGVDNNLLRFDASGDMWFNAGAFGNNVLHMNGTTGAVTISNAFALPTTDGTANQVMVTNGSGVLTWASVPGLSNPAIGAQTADYTALAGDNTILIDASSVPVTITIPAASTNSGKIYVIKAIDITNAAMVTSAGGNIDDAISHTFTTQYESIEIQSDGTQWWIIS